MNARAFSTMHSFNRNRSLTGSNPRPLYYVAAQVRPRRPGVLALHEKLRRRARSAASAARKATPRSHRQVRRAVSQSPTQIPKYHLNTKQTLTDHPHATSTETSARWRFAADFLTASARLNTSWRSRTFATTGSSSRTRRSWT